MSWNKTSHDIRPFPLNCAQNGTNMTQSLTLCDPWIYLLYESFCTRYVGLNYKSILCHLWFVPETFSAFFSSISRKSLSLLARILEDWERSFRKLVPKWLSGKRSLMIPSKKTNMRRLFSFLICNMSKVLIIPRLVVSVPMKFFNSSAVEGGSYKL